MKRRLTQTLLGRLAESWKLSTRLFSGRDLDQSERLGGKAKCLKHPAFSLQHSANVQRSTLNVKLLTVILLTCIQLLAGMGVARAAILVNNTAELNYADNRHKYFAPVQDTAAVLVVSPPNISITKDVYNVRTGETSPDVVIAIRSDTVEFLLRFTNSGEANAENVSMHDTIPAGTTYIMGSARDTNSIDPVAPPDTITFQHITGGPFDTDDSGQVTAIRWQWNKIEGITGYNTITTRFRVRVQ